MTLTEPTFTVSEVAEATGLTAHTLRYYEKEGLIAPVDRGDSSGHRTYRKEDLRAIEFLKRLRATGMPIALMRRYVSLVRAGDHTTDERREILTAHRDEVLARMAEMQEHLEAIEYKLSDAYGVSKHGPIGAAPHNGTDHDHATGGT